jgi:smad nuclear-interacting protein 1
MDLQSTNGTILNGQKLDDSRYYELKEKDVLKFGFSTREYVLLREELADEVDGEDTNQ